MDDEAVKHGVRDFRNEQATLDPARRARIDAQVNEAVAGTFTPTPVTTARAGRRRPRLAWWGASAVGLLAVVLLIVSFGSGRRDPAAVRTSPAPASLDELIEQVAASPTVTLGPDEVLHRVSTRTTGWSMVGDTVDEAVIITEHWVRADGWLRERVHDEVITTGGSTSIGMPGGDVEYESWSGPGLDGLSQPTIDGLAAEPNALETALRQVYGDPDPRDAGALATGVARLLSWPTTPAAVRSAGLRWFAEQGGVYEAAPGDVPDEIAAVEPVAIDLVSEGEAITVWFDPVRSIVVGHRVAGRTVTYATDVSTAQP